MNSLNKIYPEIVEFETSPVKEMDKTTENLLDIGQMSEEVNFEKKKELVEEKPEVSCFNEKQVEKIVEVKPAVNYFILKQKMVEEKPEVKKEKEIVEEKVEQPR